MWLFAVLSDLTQMLSLSIVCRALVGVVWAKKGTVCVCSHRCVKGVSAGRRTVPALSGRMWHRFFGAIFLLQGC